jgi:hypothetical protein
MKKYILLSVLALTIFSFSYSQDPEFNYYKNQEIKTLLGRNRAGGGYCAFTGAYSLIDDRQSVLFGARFGWLAGHSVGVGIGANGFINEFHYEPLIDRNVFLAGGYGGLYIEPILFPKLPVHLSLPVLLGGGGISYVSDDPGYNNNLIEDTEAFLIIEPGAEIELNLTRFFRLAVGATYRFPTAFDVGLTGTQRANAESLKGLSYTVSLKFGKF